MSRSIVLAYLPILLVVPLQLFGQEEPIVSVVKYLRPGPVRPDLLRVPFSPAEAARVQKKWADYLKVPSREQDKAGHTMVLIPAGAFDMGSTQAERRQFVQWYRVKPDRMKDETPHRVQITRPFYLAAHEVSRGQFRQFVEEEAYRTEAATDGRGGVGWNEKKGKFEGRSSKFHWKNTGFRQTDDHPVVNVTWNDAQAYCKWLSKKECLTYRLPTEAEWEYACRAGASSAYSFGDEPEKLIQFGNIADRTAKEKLTKYSHWICLGGKDGHVFTAARGVYQANAFGLCDMHGNVSEWCQDAYAKQYYDSFAGRIAVNPQGDDRGRKLRVLRGGSWSLPPVGVRSASRAGGPPGHRDGAIGFRVARNVL